MTSTVVVCLLVSAGVVISDQRTASAQARAAVVRLMTAESERAHTARDGLAGLVGTADVLVAATATEPSVDGAREAVRTVLVTARPLLSGTSTAADVERLTAAASALEVSIDRLRQAQGAVQAAHDADAAAAAQAAAESAAADAAAATRRAAADAEAAVQRAATAAAAAQQRTAARATATAAATPGYDGTNGRIDPALLCDIPFLSDHQVLCRALPDLIAFSDAYRAQFGIPLPIDPWPESCYRSYDQQVATFARYGSPRAAVPGTSNHGWGKAIDIDDAVGADGNPLYGFGTPGYIWMVANGPRFGWAAPDWALQNGANPEPWHLEYVR
ncbi:MAG TPA: M15 family metallopeptidase [Cellulomonadaceae bacterium]|nr:M15 family metallopeptidase [Cellulomonadaceae bacterium]